MQVSIIASISLVGYLRLILNSIVREHNLHFVSFLKYGQVCDCRISFHNFCGVYYWVYCNKFWGYDSYVLIVSSGLWYLVVLWVDTNAAGEFATTIFGIQVCKGSVWTVLLHAHSSLLLIYHSFFFCRDVHHHW
jgi:hypothetical protein